MALSSVPGGGSDRNQRPRKGCQPGLGPWVFGSGDRWRWTKVDSRGQMRLSTASSTAALTSRHRNDSARRQAGGDGARTFAECCRSCADDHKMRRRRRFARIWVEESNSRAGRGLQRLARRRKGRHGSQGPSRFTHPGQTRSRSTRSESGRSVEKRTRWTRSAHERFDRFDQSVHLVFQPDGDPKRLGRRCASRAVSPYRAR